MSAGNRPKSNPWTKTNVPKSKKAQQKGNNVGPSLGASGEAKFKEAQALLHNSVQKHINDYESSSDEDDLDSVQLLGKFIKLKVLKTTNLNLMGLVNR